MATENITIKDYNLLLDAIKSLTKMAESAKFNLSPNGLSIYGKNKFARCEITTDSISSENEFFFCIKELSTFFRLLTSVKDIHEDDFTDVKMTFDGSFVRFSSKRFKNKYKTCHEEDISDSVSVKVTTPYTPKFEFTTTSDYIKRVNGHTFLFKDIDSLRIYINIDKEMENNAIYASLGNEANDLENDVSLKMGLLNFGAVDERLIIDMDRLNIFNMLNSDEIRIQAMSEKKVLLCKTTKCGKNGSFFNLNVYVWLLVK